VTAVTAVIVGTRIPRAVTAVITAPKDHLEVSWCGNGHHQMWGSLLKRSVSRGPQPGHSQRSYVQLKWGVGGDSDIRVNGPKRLGGLSEQIWPPASNKAREAGQLTIASVGTEGL
jgi:hypothetical protein